ncbi:hypothetical protein OAE36_00260 [bacterium]|nr:hypothetical protein [bacterium]
MTDLQKFAWTIAFSGLYLIAGIRACNWLTSQLGDLNVVAQLLMLPFIALLIAAPGSFLVFKLWEKG